MDTEQREKKQLERRQSWQYLTNGLGKIGGLPKFKMLSKCFFAETLSAENCAKQCALKAYPDMTRHTITWNSETSKKDKEDWKDHVTDLVSDEINFLFSETSNINFNSWHEKTCDVIIASKPVYLSKLNYGLAQKILNMTLKNILVAAEVIREEQLYVKLDEIRNELHVPVDTYVLQAAYSQLGIRDFDGCKLSKDEELVNREGKKYKWSKIEKYDLYMAFQTRVRKAIKNRDDYESPINWEFDAWMLGISSGSVNIG